MFALVVGDTIYLRTDARNRPDYEKLGLTPHHALAFPGFVRKPAKPRRGGKAQAPAARVRRLRGTAG